MKKFLKILFFIILIPFILFILIYLYLNTSYFLNKKTFVEIYDIQGNENGYVPQGLTYSEKYNVILQTSYNKKDISMLYVIDFSNGKLLKELKLKDNNEDFSHSHVGGITTNDDKVWITNDYKINEYSLEEIINTENDYIISTKISDTYNRGDYCYYKDNILWIGDFHTSIYMKSKNNKPLLLGYELTENIDYNNPKYAISTPNMIQGMTMLKDNSIVFTTSFSNVIRSRLLIYSNILEQETNNYYEINDNKIPYYHLDKTNLKRKVLLSPMAEGLFYKDSYLYILYENSSDEYEFTYPKIRKIVKYKTN